MEGGQILPGYIAGHAKTAGVALAKGRPDHARH